MKTLLGKELIRKDICSVSGGTIGRNFVVVKNDGELKIKVLNTGGLNDKGKLFRIPSDLLFDLIKRKSKYRINHLQTNLFK